MSASFSSEGNISHFKHEFTISVNIGPHIYTLSLSRPMLKLSITFKSCQSPHKLSFGPLFDGFKCNNLPLKSKKAFGMIWYGM